MHKRGSASRALDYCLHLEDSWRPSGGSIRPPNAGNYTCWKRRASILCNNLLVQHNREGSRMCFSSPKSNFFFHFYCFVASQKRKGQVCGEARIFFFPFLSRQANDFLLLIHPSKWFMGAKNPTPSPLQNKQSLKSCNGAQKLRAAAFDTFNFSKNMLLFYFPILSVSTFSTNNKISCFTVSLIRFSSFHPKQRAENANLSVRRLH